MNDADAAAKNITDNRTTDEADPFSEKNSSGFINKLRSFAGISAAAKPVYDTVQSSDQITGQGSAVNAPRTRRDMIERVIAFDEKRVFDVMLPRADIEAVEINTSLQDLIQHFSDAGHSRMPVYRSDLDDPVGMVHIKDLIGTLAEHDHALEKNADQKILSDIIRTVIYVPPSMRVVDLFLRMQVSRIHMALVIDEYGGTDGLVTIEDLIEEIVGEINDEHDEDDGPMISDHDGGGWDADARLDLEELETLTNASFIDTEDDVETLGGLVFALAGRVPLRGEIITHPAGYEFEVLEGDVRKIRKIRIRPIKKTTGLKETPPQQ